MWDVIELKWLRVGISGGLVNTEFNSLFHERGRISQTTERLLDSQEGFCSMESEMVYEGVDWIQLAHDKDHCRDLISSVLKFWVS
jgi:hypothetical protein